MTVSIKDPIPLVLADLTLFGCGTGLAGRQDVLPRLELPWLILEAEDLPSELITQLPYTASPLAYTRCLDDLLLRNFSANVLKEKVQYPLPCCIAFLILRHTLGPPESVHQHARVKPELQ
ncbi:MAG: hypothetical protein K6T35_03520, partial [Meiothermus silvanus]|nr:hypothetical protein [Allomeiothermus silvanus]